jgi:hypothetical protein
VPVAVNDPVTVCDPLNWFDPVVAYDPVFASLDTIRPANDEETVLNEDVVKNDVESNPSNISALVAYEAVPAIPASDVIDPDRIVFPVTVREPDMKGEFSIIYFVLLLL